MQQLPRSRGPFARLLAALALLAAFTVAFFLGTVLFLVVLGAAVLLGIVLSLRFWWLRRRWAREAPPPDRPEARRGVTLEGEYTRKGDPGRR
jgi:uncharacterized iron-regulated membrane protein